MSANCFSSSPCSWPWPYPPWPWASQRPAPRLTTEATTADTGDTDITGTGMVDTRNTEGIPIPGPSPIQTSPLSPNLSNIPGIVCQCNTVLFNPIPTHTLTISVQNSFQLFTYKRGRIFDKRISIAGLTLPIQCARQFGM